jgi:hypothetical protein
MRLDPAHIGDLTRQLAGGALDAARGQDAQREADAAQGEAAYEPLDQLLLKRLQASSMEDAAAVTTFAEALEQVQKTRAQYEADPTSAAAAQGELDRDRLRDLLGGA